MELEGKIIQVNQLQSGQGKNGTWKKQEYIIETKSQYPKKVCVTVWGDKIDQFSLNQNEDVTLSIELEVANTTEDGTLMSVHGKQKNKAMPRLMV